MNKSQKLFDSIGRLDDKDLALALEYKAEQPIKPRMRFSAIMAAAVVAVSLMLMAFSYGDEILNAIFKRRTELVDEKIGYIDESATAGNITLTVDKVTVDEKWALGDISATYTVSFHNEDGIFDRGLKYGSSKLEVFWNIDDEPAEWRTVSGDIPNERVLFSDAISAINFGLDNPTDTITLTSRLSVGLYSDTRLTFYDLTSADGSIKYADEISVEFTVTENVAKPLKQLSRYNPGTEFAIEDSIFAVDQITVEVDKMYVEVYNPDGDSVNIGGVDCCAINYFTLLSNGEKFFEINKRYSDRYNEVWQHCESLGDDEGLKAYDEWRSSDEYIGILVDMVNSSTPTDDKNVLNECYEILVELKPECGAQITSISSYNDGYPLPATPDSIKATMKAEFSSPIYVDDIVRVYARKIGDPSVEVNIWVPAEDESLESYLN